MEFRYKTKGVCSKEIFLKLNGHIIEEVTFTGGCHGNLQGVSALVKGANAYEIIDRLKGIKCGFKSSSCPDQLAIALESALNEGKES